MPITLTTATFTPSIVITNFAITGPGLGTLPRTD